jgi:hypothetical protein
MTTEIHKNVVVKYTVKAVEIKYLTYKSGCGFREFALSVHPTLHWWKREDPTTRISRAEYERGWKKGTAEMQEFVNRINKIESPGLNLGLNDYDCEDCCSQSDN